MRITDNAVTPIGTDTDTQQLTFLSPWKYSAWYGPPTRKNATRPRLVWPRLSLYRWGELSDGEPAFWRDTPPDTYERYWREVGADLGTELLKRAQPINFPATHESTLVPDDQRHEQTFSMRYVPRIFDGAKHHPGLVTLYRIYRDVLPRIIHQDLGIVATPLEPGERSAEAFLVHPDQNEQLDPHRDERLTVAFYLSSGSGLVVSHHPGARTMTELRALPVSIVWPAMGTFVLFDGRRHPHVGISSGLTPEMPAQERLDKLFDNQGFWVSGHYGNTYAAHTPDVMYGAWMPRPELHGHRIVISMNYRTPEDAQPPVSTLDQVFSQLTTA